MSNKKIEIDVLYEMIQVNDKRAKNYNKAIKDLHSDDAELKAIFAGMSRQSTHYKQALTQALQQLSAKSSMDRMFEKLSQTWLDAKIAFTGRDRNAVLRSCELGEKAIDPAYEMALDAN